MIVNPEKDSIRIYKCGKTMKGRIEILGKREKIEVSEDSAFFLWEPKVHIGKAYILPIIFIYFISCSTLFDLYSFYIDDC